MLTAPRRASARLLVLAVSLTACSGSQGAAGNSAASSGSGASSGTAARIDAIAANVLKSGHVAGFSIGAMKGNDTIAMKGYGSADLELDVPTPSHAIYEIGSVTKQFTAAAIMQLRDDGKLSLDDEFTKYIPGYPTQGNRISVRRLLDHTSGIKGYTEMPKFGEILALDLPRDTLISMFRNAPFNFKTGDAMIYNNSAYFLAGLVIEKVSGMSYADYLQKTFFDKLGMKDTHYCSEAKIMKGKVKGYDMNPDSTLRNKRFLAHVYPYAAGSICSSVNDMVTWNRALHNGKVLSPASYTEMITPGVLNDGTKLRYGTGLAMRDKGGHRLIEHGGGINGFVSASGYYPDDSLTVVVLLNTAGIVSADDVADSVATAILGRQEAKDSVFAGDLATLTGTFGGVDRGGNANFTVKAEGTSLVLTNSQSPRVDTLRFAGGNMWRRGEGTLTFDMSGGKASVLRVDDIYGYAYLRRKN